MNQLRLLSLVVLLAGCSNSDPSASRKVSGQLSTRSLLTLDNPAIVVTTGDGERKVFRVARTGEFDLQVPTNTSLRLGIATTLKTATLRETSTILWPNRTSLVRPGAPIDLGVVRRPGEDSIAPTPEREAGGVDDGDDRCEAGSMKADLPYDAKLPLGSSFRLSNAFYEKGSLPAQILSVTMSGGSWRLTELKADTVFAVTQADCQHEGNRSTGRDRIEVTWKNHDGSTETDHLDMRYCDGDSAPPAAPVASTGSAPIACTPTEVCDDGSDDGEHGCDNDQFEGVLPGGDVARPSGCDPAPTPTPVPAPTPGGTGAACTTNSDCSASTACFESTCVPRIN
jgi:hypothetical protein